MSAKQPFVRVVSCHEHERIESVDDLDAHAASRSLDHARSSFEVCRIEILHLRLRDLLRFRARHLGDFRLVRLTGSFFVMNVNERSSKTVISTGMTRPACLAVLSLNSLTKAMILTPAWPSAGPTGGAGLAFPATTCSLTSFATFFAILLTPP